MLSKSKYFINFQVLGDDCNLKLSQIFRTPKDFSDANFDQFELLERNNFDASAERSDPVLKNEIFRPPQALPRSIANAQVMVRFGGDDIHGKNYLRTIGNLVNHPTAISHPLLRHFCYNHDLLHPTHFPGFPTDIFPDPDIDFPLVGHLPPYPPHLQHYYHFHPPPPPFAFPGFYYHPLSRPGFFPPINNHITEIHRTPVTTKGKFKF